MSLISTGSISLDSTFKLDFCWLLWEQLPTPKIFPEPPFRELVVAVWKPPMTRKIVLHGKPALGLEITTTCILSRWLLKYLCTSIIMNKENFVSWNRKSDVAFSKIFRLANVFTKAGRGFFTFIYITTIKKFKNHLRLYKKFWPGKICLKLKICISWHSPFITDDISCLTQMKSWRGKEQKISVEQRRKERTNRQRRAVTKYVPPSPPPPTHNKV
jgi:hypothetical protein